MRKNSRQTLRDQALKIIRTWERARRKPRRAEIGLVWFGLVVLLGFSRVLRSYARSDRLWQTADAARMLICATPLHPSRGTICLQRPAVFHQPLSTICLAAHLDDGSY
jgi:hypothetical protein